MKIAIVAMLALAAIVGSGATSAQAAQFHCSVEPCRVTLKPDGTGKTAHHVMLVKGEKGEATLTCGQLHGEGTSSAKTASELTITALEYVECTLAGTPAFVKMNGCDFLANAAGYTSVSCPSGKEIEFGLEGKCTVKIPVPVPVVGLGVKYHNVSEKKEEMTAETSVSGIEGTATGASCPMGTGAITGTYTTGNLILTGETTAGVMANAWWE
ncbi:MAG: hypothetical protein ABW065_02750 [Solirubrobacterales bacterium]